MLNNNESLYSSSILIADDGPLSTRWLQKFLVELGYQNIESVGDSKEIIKTFNDKQPDVIFLELKMPGSKGVTILDDLRACCVKPRLPVIALASESDLKTRLMAHKWGVREFLGQPYHLNEIRFRTKHVLETYL